MPHIGQSAQPIIDVTGQQVVAAGPAIPIEYVTGGPVMGGAAQPVVVVTDGRPQAEMQALPVVAVAGGAVKGGLALPVYVVGAVAPSPPPPPLTTPSLDFSQASNSMYIGVVS